MFTRRRFLAAAGSIAGFHIVPRWLVAGADQPPPSEGRDCHPAASRQQISG